MPDVLRRSAQQKRSGYVAPSPYHDLYPETESPRPIPSSRCSGIAYIGAGGRDA
jgi:hypothetical protein